MRRVDTFENQKYGCVYRFITENEENYTGGNDCSHGFRNIPQLFPKRNTRRKLNGFPRGFSTTTAAATATRGNSGKTPFRRGFTIKKKKLKNLCLRKTPAQVEESRVRIRLHCSTVTDKFRQPRPNSVHPIRLAGNGTNFYYFYFIGRSMELFDLKRSL